MNQTAIIIALSTTIVELNAQVEELSTASKDLLDDHMRRGDLLAGQEETISSLQESLRYAEDDRSQAWGKTQTLQEEVYQLKAELASLRAKDPELHAKAHDYMVKLGQFLRSTYLGEEHRWDKIGCIKQVREITGFGLKDAKDLVELWVAGHPGTCQDEPKHTPSPEGLRPTLVSALRPSNGEVGG